MELKGNLFPLYLLWGHLWVHFAFLLPPLAECHLPGIAFKWFTLWMFSVEHYTFPLSSKFNFSNWFEFHVTFKWELLSSHHPSLCPYECIYYSSHQFIGLVVNCYPFFIILLSNKINSHRFLNQEIFIRIYWMTCKSNHFTQSLENLGKTKLNVLVFLIASVFWNKMAPAWLI